MSDRKCMACNSASKHLRNGHCSTCLMLSEQRAELTRLRAEVERLRRVEYAAMAVVTSRDEADDYLHKAVVSRHCLADLAAALSAKPAPGGGGG